MFLLFKFIKNQRINLLSQIGGINNTLIGVECNFELDFGKWFVNFIDFLLIKFCNWNSTQRWPNLSFFYSSGHLREVITGEKFLYDNFYWLPTLIHSVTWDVDKLKCSINVDYFMAQKLCSLIYPDQDIVPLKLKLLTLSHVPFRSINLLEQIANFLTREIAWKFCVKTMTALWFIS